MAFDEIQFPTDIARGASSVPKRVTDVITLRSGFEERNTPWADSRRSFNVGLGVQNLADVYSVIDFWEGRRSGLRGFRFKDWSDFRSGNPTQTPSNTDQAMASLTSTTYQLQKVYSPSSNPWTRTITKPVENSVVLKDDTGALVEDTDYTVDYTTGVVTFMLAPTGTPTAGFEFDVPVRFANEELEINIALVDVGSAPDISLVEVRV